MKIDKKWLKLVTELDFAFQPIVNTKTGKIFAVEALLRKTNKVGFDNIFDFFDEAYKREQLYNTDLLLRGKAIHKFIDIDINNIMLFFNLDNRILFDESYEKGNTKSILKKLELKKKSICFELSERGSLPSAKDLAKVLKNYKDEGFKIAIDDFGQGISGMELLYNSNPNFLKIDKFFIRYVPNDIKKQIILNSIVTLSHQLGIKVIAEGVETKDELKWCQSLNIDFIQGYYIQKPQLNISKLQSVYDFK